MISRRVAAAGLLAGASVRPTAAATPAAVRRERVYVGTYTPNGGGVHVFDFDTRTGALSPVTVMRGIANPTWLVVDAPRRRLFALSEVGDYGPARTGAVAAFALREDGGLDPINTVGSGGAGPAHMALHPSGRHLLVANYGGGSVAVLPVGGDGRLGEPTDVRQGAPRPVPQVADPTGNFAGSDHAGSHMHMVAADPTGRFVIACDAGADRIHVWRFDAEHGRLYPARQATTDTPPGSAPRHFVFQPGGRVLHVLREHDARIASYTFDPASGDLRLLGVTPTLPEGFSGSDLASELAISDDGRTLYAANRLRNAITTFTVSASGRLRRVAETWAEGDYPRSFGLSRDGRWLLCACQRSDALTTFRVGPRGGAPTFTGAFTAVGSPAAVVFAAAPGS